MFTRDGVEIACPDSAAGLYIRTRNNQIVKVCFLFSIITSNIGYINDNFFYIIKTLKSVLGSSFFQCEEPILWLVNVSKMCNLGLQIFCEVDAETLYQSALDDTF